MTVAELIEALERLPQPWREIAYVRFTKQRFEPATTRRIPIRAVIDEGSFVQIDLCEDV